MTRVSAARAFLSRSTTVAVDERDKKRRLSAVPQPVQAAIVLAALVVFLLWTPLTSRGYYAPVDILQGYEVGRVAPEGYRIENPLMGDPVFQMYPWTNWNRAELRDGRLPVWNPYNGAGTPHLANFISATFSPFTAPFYALPFRAALVVAAFLKLFLLGLFTYLFLREVRLAHVAALVGAVAFMFSAYNLLWLNWPQPGAAVLLPAALLFVERAVQAADDRRRLARSLLGLALVTAGGLLAGHPETTFFGLVVVAPYALLRVALSPAAWRKRVARGLQLGGAAALGAGLAAMQLIPFLEYLQRSTAYAARSHAEQYHFDLRFVSLHAFPGLLGSPRHRYQDVAMTTNNNYNEATSFHIGLIVVFLAAVGIASLVRRRSLLVPFFTVAAAVWFAYAYDIAGVGGFLTDLPIVRLGAVTRSHIVWLFSLSCLAAAGVDLLARAAPSRRRALLGAAAVAAGAGGLFGWAIVTERGFRIWLASLPGNTVTTALARTTAREHIWFVSITFGVGVVAALALVLAGRRPWVKLGAGAVLTAMVFMQSGFMLRHYNPTIEPRYFYPVSSALAEINRRTGGEQTLRLAGAVLPPDSNLWYRTFSPDSYDALGVKTYDTLRNRLYPPVPVPGAAAPAPPPPSPRAPVLRALGVRYVVTTEAQPLTDVAGLEPAWSSGRVRLYRVSGSPPRYFSPAEARPVASDAAALRALERPGFDAGGTVLLHAPVPGGRSAAGTVQVLSESATEVRLRVRRDRPGWMVALRSHYPGWKAEVDGRAVPLVRANVAFSAVAVGAGTREVVLRYRPTSVRLGLLVTVLSGLVLVAGTLLVASGAGRARLVARGGRARR